MSKTTAKFDIQRIFAAMSEKAAILICARFAEIFSNSIGRFTGARRHSSGRRNQASRLVLRFPHAVAGTAEKETPVVLHLDPAMQTES